MSKEKEIRNANIPQMNVNRLIEELTPAYSNIINAGLPIKVFPSVMLWGPPGVGKTELAKVIAKSFERDFFRIQCYEGITFEQIVGEWNYQKQLLHLEAARQDSNKEDKIFDEEFFIRRTLLNAFLNEKPSPYSKIKNGIPKMTIEIR